MTWHGYLIILGYLPSGAYKRHEVVRGAYMLLLPCRMEKELECYMVISPMMLFCLPYPNMLISSTNQLRCLLLY